MAALSNRLAGCRACKYDRGAITRCPARLVHNVSVLKPLTSTPANTVSDAYLLQCMQLVVQYVGAIPPDRASAQRAFGVLYDNTVQRVHAMVRRFVHDEATAQEVTEDVFFMAWSQAARFDATRGGVMAWLLTMARSKAIDAWRQHAARTVQFDSDVADDALAQVCTSVTPVDLLEAMDRQHALHAALVSVSPAARTMISLAFFQGLTHSEISAHLGTPLGTVKTTLRRALLTLREVLQSSLGADMPQGLVVED
jgi:RNA polymerase sigma factor (sigma-70 family)